MVETKIDIYSARLKFKRDSKTVVVDIRYNKIDKPKRIEFPIPEDIDLYELKWVRYRKQIISTYHRITKDNNHEYMDQKHTIVPISLGQRLEKLVSDTYSFILKQ